MGTFQEGDAARDVDVDQSVVPASSVLNQEPENSTKAQTAPFVPAVPLAQEQDTLLATADVSQKSLSPEFLKKCQQEIVDALSTSKENWSALNKDERCDRMLALCDAIVMHGRQVSNALEHYLGSLPEIDVNALHDKEPVAVKAALEAHAAEEELVADALAELQLARFLLVQEVYRSGRNEYSTSTGLFDDMPKASAWITTGLGLASLSGAIGLAIYTHEVVHHVVHDAVTGIAGNGILGSALFYPVYGVSLFLEGIPVLSSSVIGPYLFGLAKTLGGRAARAGSNDLNESFASEAQAATGLNTKIHETIAALDESCSGPARNLTEFFAINNDLRRAASTVVARLENGEVQSEAGMSTDLHALNWKLGVNETVEIVRFLNLRRGLQNLSDIDVRSQELQEVAAQLEGAKVSEERQKGFVGVARHAIGTALKTVWKLGKSSDDVGAQRAIEMTEELHHQFEALPTNLLADPVSGLGAGISATLHMAFETGERPERALLEAVKGTVGIFKNAVVGGVAEGPTGDTLFDVLFEMDELKTGNKIRWGFKFAPTLALAVLKKPALILKAEKKEAAKGNLSPNLFRKELTEKEGRGYGSWLALKEVCKVSGQAFVGIVKKVAIELPLKAGSRLKTSLPVLKHIAPLCMNRLDASKEKQHRLLSGRIDRSEQALKYGNVYRQMSDPDFEVAVVGEFLEYQYGGDESLSKKEMIDLLGYWTDRRKLRFLESEQRKLEHQKELLAESPLLTKLRKVTQPSIGFTTKISQLWNALKASKADLEAMKQPRLASEPNVPVALAAFVTSYNKKKPAVSGGPVILDGTREGLIVYRNGEGNIELLSGLDARRRIIQDWREVNSTKESVDDRRVRLLPNAHEARLATAMIVTATPLEPAEQKALLVGHEIMKKSGTKLNEVVKDMLVAGFTERQLFGNGTDTAEEKTPGILRLGLIGDRVPTDAQLDTVRRELSKR